MGEILFDHFPEYSRVGGAPFNFACHLTALGFDVRFLSRLGRDEDGTRARELMEAKGVSSDLVQEDEDRATGAVIVELDAGGNPAFDIRPDAAYDYLEPTPEAVEAARNADLIYFGSLVQRTGRGSHAVNRILEAGKKNAKRLYDINLRPGCYSDEIIESSLGKCDILKLNDNELHHLMVRKGFSGSEEDFTLSIMDGDTIEAVALTRGENGSVLFTRTGTFSAAPVPNITVADTVGAGDAYAAVLAAGFLDGLDPARIVTAASGFAARVCGIRGALPDDPAFYDDLREIFGRGRND